MTVLTIESAIRMERRPDAAGYADHKGQTRSVIALFSVAALQAGSLLAPPELAARSMYQQEAQRSLILQAESRMSLEGSSTLHDWSCEATEVNASISVQMSRDPATNAADLGTVEWIAIDVPVQAIKCGLVPMERRLYRTLNANVHPAIEFRLTDFTFGPVLAMRWEMAVAVSGQLTVAGATREINLDVRVGHDDSSSLRFRGHTAIVMSDFGIEPPSEFFGLLRVHDRLEVIFDLTTTYDNLAAHLGTDGKSVGEYVRRWIKASVPVAAASGTGCLSTSLPCKERKLQ